MRPEEDQADQRQQIQQDSLILMSSSQAGTLTHPELCNVIEIQSTQSMWFPLHPSSQRLRLYLRLISPLPTKKPD